MLIKVLEKTYQKFKKFLASRIFGKKYVRVGKCNACGRCCQSIYVRHSSHVIKEEKEFEKLKSQHFFYSFLKVTGKNETGLIFECAKLDKETHKCTVHSHRPLICRQYPQEEIFMMGGIITEDCGYKFIPIKSFEEVFNKIKEKKGF